MVKRIKKSRKGGPKKNKARVVDRRIRFICDEAKRKVVPVLQARFQADVPEWTAPIPINDYENDPYSLKWLGTKTWPPFSSADNGGIIIGNDQNDDQLIGQGRSAVVCSCHNQGSADCVKVHVGTERIKLQTELGPVFETWEFHELGDQGEYWPLWDWTINEYLKLDDLVKITPIHQRGNFLAKAIKALPSRKREIFRYYYNIFIPERFRSKTRLGYQVKTDDDEGG